MKIKYVTHTRFFFHFILSDISNKYLVVVNIFFIYLVIYLLLYLLLLLYLFSNLFHKSSRNVYKKKKK